MTQRYAHLSPAYQRAMVDRMEAIWARPAPASIETVVSLRTRPSRRSTPAGQRLKSSRIPNNSAQRQTSLR